MGLSYQRIYGYEKRRAALPIISRIKSDTSEWCWSILGLTGYRESKTLRFLFKLLGVWGKLYQPIDKFLSNRIGGTDHYKMKK